MNPRPPVDDAAIEPTRTLSFSNPRDFIEVLAWTLWSPLMFVFYTKRFVLTHDENTRFPDLAAILHDRREFTHWQQYNPAQWALVKIACVVGALVLLGVIVLNAVFALPLPRFTDFEVFREAFLLTGWLFLLLTVQLVGGLWLAGRYYNVGYLLAAALPGGVALAFMVLFSLWVQHLPAYLVATSPWMLFVFALWGYATGFYVNFVLAVAYRRINRFTYLLLALLVVTLGATAFLLTLRGVTLQNYSMAWTDEYRFVVLAGLCWGGGLVLGVVRMVEWLVCEYQKQPRVTDIPGKRGWTVPGATQIPVGRLDAELDQWLHFDWQRGVHVVAAVARVAGQENPWAGALRGRLAADDGEDIGERLAAVYDGGIARADVVLKPPKPKKKTGSANAGSGGGEAEPPAKPKGQKRYQQETLLAYEIGHRAGAPPLEQEGDQRSVEAAFWYYSQGYLFEAADILEKLKRSNSKPASALLEELRVLVTTYQLFLDLEAVSRLPAVALRDKPQVPQRKGAWEAIDLLAAAARWAWRARRCDDPGHRRFCREKFDKVLKKLGNRTKLGHMAERKLVRGIIAMWGKQFNAVVRSKTPAEMPPIRLRPWNQIYQGLGDDCPWKQASEILWGAWLPGETAITIVDGQPFAGVRETVEFAVAGNSIQAVLVWCDVKQWERRAVTFVDICQFLCQEIAHELGTTDMIPALAELRAQPLPVTCDSIHRMCRSMPDRCVVLALRNVEVFGSVLPDPTVGAVFDVLSKFEENIANFSLVLQTTDVPATLDRLKDSRPNGIRTLKANVKLLSAKGITLWLKEQFGESGVWFTPDGYEAVTRLTGGHPRLLRVWARCLCDAYNSKHHPLVDSPIAMWVAIYAASAHSDFQEAVQLYSRSLAHRLRHDSDPDVRVLLYATAERDLSQHTPITPHDVQALCAKYRPLTLDFIMAKYQEWAKLEVLTEVQTSLGLGYHLRCFAFAQWLQSQGHSIPTAQQSAAPPPRTPPQPPTP